MDYCIAQFPKSLNEDMFLEYFGDVTEAVGRDDLHVFNIGEIYTSASAVINIDSDTANERLAQFAWFKAAVPVTDAEAIATYDETHAEVMQRRAQMMERHA